MVIKNRQAGDEVEVLGLLAQSQCNRFFWRDGRPAHAFLLLLPGSARVPVARFQAYCGRTELVSNCVSGQDPFGSGCGGDVFRERLPICLNCLQLSAKVSKGEIRTI